MISDLTVLFSGSVRLLEIKYLSLNDKKDFSKYDLVYIGSGTDKNLLLALDDLIKYKKDIKNYIDKNKFMLVTGNAIELFGEYIRIMKCFDSFLHICTLFK